MKQEISKSESLIKTIGFLIISIFVMGLGISSTLQLIGVDELISAIFSSQVGILLLGLLLMDLDKDIIRKRITPKINFSLIATSLLSFLTILVANLSISFVVSKFGTFTSEFTENIVSNSSMLVTIIFPVIIAPIFEEITFRAGMRYALTERSDWSNKAYVLISSILFGVLHVQAGPMFIVPVIITFSIGVVLSIAYIRTNNILVPILGHMMYNGFIVYTASLIS